MGSYIIATLYAWKGSPGSVARKNFTRAAMYPMDFLLSYGFILFLYTKPHLFEDETYLAIACTMECCCGLLNVLTYAFQHWHAQAALLGTDLQDCTPETPQASTRTVSSPTVRRSGSVRRITSEFS